MLGGLVAASAGWPEGDSIAALFVAALVLVAATRLMRRNVDVLMDRAPAAAEEAARAAIARIEPPVQLRAAAPAPGGGSDLRRRRHLRAAGRAVGQGHAAADRVEDELERVLPGIDVVVHVEPRREEASCASARTRRRCRVPRVREIHNLSLVSLDGRTEVSLHLKLPGELPLEEAHEIAEQVEREIVRARPGDRLGADPPRAAR